LEAEVSDEEVLHIARRAAAKFWQDRAAKDARLCGERDAEVILAGGADQCAEVIAAKNAILMLQAGAS
jgi:hypothetical protein